MKIYCEVIEAYRPERAYSEPEEYAIHRNYSFVSEGPDKDGPFCNNVPGLAAAYANQMTGLDWTIMDAVEFGEDSDPRTELWFKYYNEIKSKYKEITAEESGLDIIYVSAFPESVLKGGYCKLWRKKEEA